jgi:hypothetical protein
MTKLSDRDFPTENSRQRSRQRHPDIDIPTETSRHRHPDRDIPTETSRQRSRQRHPDRDPDRDFPTETSRQRLPDRWLHRQIKAFWQMIYNLFWENFATNDSDMIFFVYFNWDFEAEGRIRFQNLEIIWFSKIIL